METLKVSELRIGNYVKMDGLNRPIKVSIIDTTETSITTKCKPIPLTEEWLLKFGFKQNGEWYELDKFYIDSTNFNCGIENPKNIYNRLKCVGYVHQLQNLYYALTGEELILNNK